MKDIAAADLETYIDQRLAAMLRAPGMWGGPLPVECACHLLIALYLQFCREGGDPKDCAPAGEVYQSFAHKMHPKRPGPMTMAQWFTDKKWGSKKTRTFENESDLEHWAGEEIVKFFIAWKKDLKGA